MIEWVATSYFSFLEGAADPEAFARTALELGYSGLGLADRMSTSGLVRAFMGAQANPDQPFFYAPGIRLHFDHAEPLAIYPHHRAAYARLCRFLSQWSLEGLNHGEKGLTPLPWKLFRDFLKSSPRDLATDYAIVSLNGRFFPWIVDPLETTRVTSQDAAPPTPSFSRPPTTPGQTPFWLLELAELCGRGSQSALSLAYPLTFQPGTEDFLEWTEDHARRLDIPLLATTLPLYTVPTERDLCELVTAIRHSKPLTELGYLKQANESRRLLTPNERTWIRKLANERLSRYALNDPFERGYELAKRHAFSLAELKYKYPRERVPIDETPAAYLARLAWAGAHQRYVNGIPPAVAEQIQKELNLIAELEYEDYFLTIHDVLEYARSQKILFQGRGSAANSALCYVLGITAIDPVKMELLFERFLSLERREPPDIDVDFEHERREEVIQEIYRRYGREHAAMVSNYICFRGPMATRETGKALGLSTETLQELATYMGRESLSRLSATPRPADLTALLARLKITPARFDRMLNLASRLRGFPRHLSIHSGGFVLSSERLSEQCVLEPARKENRSVVPWDKDDVDALGWMKVDLLSLGMLTAIRKGFDLIGARGPNGDKFTLATVPQDDPAVFRAMQRADTVGVFQIESRAQMNMLPRLAPKNFYDIVIEVAIVRPGPLQGGMVHPYLKRRQGREAVTYEHPALEPILKRTLGISIFQEQVMKIAVAVGGFTPGEADQLRKVMSGAWRSKSNMHLLRERLIAGMTSKGISLDLSERLYRQIEGFGEYGFPESHAASFALLTYTSTWMKVHYPGEFLCALLNSQPLGFYSPRALVGDAERHGVKARPVDVLHSSWLSTMDPLGGVRLGLHLIQGLSADEGARIERLQRAGFLDPQRPPKLEDLRHRGLELRTIETLIRAKACRSLAATPQNVDPRRHQLWQSLGMDRSRGEAAPTLWGSEAPLPRHVPAALAPLDEWGALIRDYQTVGLTPGKHPATYAREKFFRNVRPWATAEDLYRRRYGDTVSVIGLLTIKQKPPTAGGVTFLTLEDETGFMNLTLHAEVYEKVRLTIESSALLAAVGRLERSKPVDPADPHTAALSLLVESLWNPFLKAPEGERPEHLKYRPRHYH